MHPRVQPRRSSRLAALAAAVAGCGVLGGCVTTPFRDAEVDPRSPIAAEVAKTVRPNAAYPTFVAFPAKPTGLRPTRQYGRDAAAVEASGDQLVKATAEDTWVLKDTEGFTAQAQVDAGPALPPANPADTEAFAKDQKARATKPPPIKR